MDYNDIALPIIIGLVLIMVLIMVLRKRNPLSSSPVQVVNSLLSDVRINLRLIEIMMEGEQIKRFAVNGWRMHHNSVGFLKESLQKNLAEVYSMAEDYTEQVTQSSKEGKGYTGTIETDKMYTCLRKCKAGLENWLMATTGTTDPGGKGGVSSFFLGN